MSLEMHEMIYNEFPFSDTMHVMLYYDKTIKRFYPFSMNSTIR